MHRDLPRSQPGAQVVAEGAEHLDALRELGCDTAQGYHYGRLMAAEPMTELLARTGLLHEGQAPAGS